MKIIKIFFVSAFLSILFAFNILAMPKNQYAGEPKAPTPSADEGYSYGDRWTWLSDELCVQFRSSGPTTSYIDRNILQRKYDSGLARNWREDNQVKRRDVYSGKWSQDEFGIWSFLFDDYTIPVSVTKIDGVLYAFNAYGELKDGYMYYGTPKTPFDKEGCLFTASDGLANSDDPEFLNWLATQYLPDCTSHE